MSARTWLAAAMAVLLVGSAGLAGATTGVSHTQTAMSDTQTQGAVSGYTHVSAEVTSNAIVDYRVDGTTVLQRVKVQSQSNVHSESSLSLGADVDALTNFIGASLSTSASAETSATITADSGATLRVHDNGHGTLVIAANEQSQYVGMNLSSAASVESESDERLVVATGNGTKTTVLVAGEGNVTVDDSGNVTAKLQQNSRIVVRTYENRDENARQQEEMIMNGTAAAQVYLTQTAEGGSQAAVDVVNYGRNTTVEVTQRTKGEVRMTVERSASRGKVVITSVTGQIFETVSDIRVRVDGEAAARASSYSELAAAADGGATSKYLVRQSAGAQAGADVYVALNHFSQRSVTMEDSGGTDTDSTTDGTATPTDETATDDGSQTTSGDATPTESDPGATDQSSPGFTAVLAVLGIAVAVGLGVRRN